MTQFPSPLPGSLPNPVPSVPVQRRGGPPDRGSPWSATIAWVAALLLLGVVVAMHQLQPSPSAGAAVGAPGGNPIFDAIAKFVVKASHTLPQAQRGEARNFVQQLDGQGSDAQTRLTMAIVAGEVEAAIHGAGAQESKDEALARLDAVTKDNAKAWEEAGLQESADAVRAVYERGVDSLTPEQRTLLIERHKYIGRLALTHGLAESDPARDAMVGGGALLIVGFYALLFLGFLVAVGAVVSFIVFIVRFSTGGSRLSFAPPSPGGSVHLESLAVFIGGFLLLQVVKPLIVSVVFGGNATESQQLSVMLVAQWGLLPLIFYPMLRGVPWSEFRRQMGWHSGRGFFREVGSGIVAYLAALPVLAVVLLITVAILFVKGTLTGAPGQPVQPPSNPILELTANASTMQLLMFVALATMWAPIVEEAVFRGSFFRHLRSRLGVLASMAISALVFGFMHGYEVLLLLPVITIGAVLAFVREWRSSLIACVTIHALHNGIVSTMLVAMLSFARA